MLTVPREYVGAQLLVVHDCRRTCLAAPGAMWRLCCVCVAVIVTVSSPSPRQHHRGCDTHQHRPGFFRPWCATVAVCKEWRRGGVVASCCGRENRHRPLHHHGHDPSRLHRGRHCAAVTMTLTLPMTVIAEGDHIFAVDGERE